MSTAATEVSLLDNPVWASLMGVHAGLAEIAGRAGRYLPDVAPFVALSDPTDPAAWADVARLIGPGGKLTLAGVDEIPHGWTVLGEMPGVQFVATSLRARPDATARRLGHDDVPAMLDLVRRTEPGPFRPRTIDLGRYLGIHRDGVLVAMAGERQFRLTGFGTRLLGLTNAPLQGLVRCRTFLPAQRSCCSAVLIAWDYSRTAARRRTLRSVRTVGTRECAMSLTEVIEGTRQAVADDAANAAVSFHVANTLAPDTTTVVNVRVRDHSFAVDEPAPLGGTDTAANPVEYALAALGSCQVITYQFWAAKLGIPLDAITVTVDGDLDLHGFFGFADVRPGFTDVRIVVDLQGPASAQRYEQLRQQVDAHCPVLDLFRNPTPTTTTLR